MLARFGLGALAIVGATACSSGSRSDAGEGADASAVAVSNVESAPLVASLTPTAGTDAGAASVLQFHNHINRDGFFVDPLLTTARAAALTRDTSFYGGFSGNVYGSPLYVENGVGGKGTFYVANESGRVVAIDETTGRKVWNVQIATPAQNTGASCSGNISPIGITGTPAIDPSTRLMVLGAVSADTSGNIATHKIYGISIDTGAVSWSVDVSTLSYSGITFSPQPQQQRGAVLIVGGIAYVPYGGLYGDCDTYHGWVVGVPLSGVGAKAWATTVPGAGIWGVGGPSSDGQSIFVSTGNGFGSQVSWAESEGLLRLDPGPSFTNNALDYFVPSDWGTLDANDTDLSGSQPLVIDAPALNPSQLVMAQGKDGFLYLVPRSNLGGISSHAAMGQARVQTGEISNAGAWATVGGTTYVVVRPNGMNAGFACANGTSGDLIAVTLHATVPHIRSAWCVNSNGVGSPSITTTNGEGNPIVWAFAADPGSTARLYGWNLTNGQVVYAGGGPNDTAANVRRFTTPIAVHGRIFVAGDNYLYAWK